MTDKIDAAAGRTANGEAMREALLARKPEHIRWRERHHDGFTSSEIAREFNRNVREVRAVLNSSEAMEDREWFLRNRQKVEKLRRIGNRLGNILDRAHQEGVDIASLGPAYQVAAFCRRGTIRPLSLGLILINCARHDGN